MTEFQSYSALHGFSVALCFVVIALAAVRGRRWRHSKPAAERKFVRTWCIFVIAYQVAILVWWLLPANLDPRTSLPLHICDLVVWCVPFALILGSRWASSLLYFWGRGLSLLAFAAPILNEGPANLEFWLFWIGHTQIVGSAVYMVVARSYAPRVRDLLVGGGATLGYAALIIPINVALGASYGMLGPTETSQALFGPWPVNVVIVLVLEVLLFVAIWIPWPILSRYVRRPVPVG